jgi:hypothetical protein
MKIILFIALYFVIGTILSSIIANLYLDEEDASDFCYIFFIVVFWGES